MAVCKTCGSPRFLSPFVTHCVQTVRSHSEQKHITRTPHEKNTKTPQTHPSQTCKATHRSRKRRIHTASGVCGERGARRLRLVILRRERSPSKGARDPAARQSVRRGPRTPRKAGDGGLTGSTTKPYSAPSPALRRPPPPRRGRGGGRARPPYPAVSRARLPDGRATPREGPRGPDAPRVEAPPPKKAARAAPAARSSCSCHVGHTTTVHPLAIDSARCCRDRSTED